MGILRFVSLTSLLISPLFPSTLTLISPPGSVNTNAFGINDALYTTGAFQTDRAGRSNFGFVRGPDGTFEIFGLTGDPYPLLTPRDINNDRLVVGSVTIDRMTSIGGRATQGFIRTADGEMTIFEKPGAELTSFTRANDQGKVLAQTYESGNYFSWYMFDIFTHEYSEISKPSEWQRMSVEGINNFGTVAGYYELPGEFFGGGFLLDTKGNIELINVPGSKQTNVNSINDVGEIVGTFLTEDDKFRGFVRQTSGEFQTFAFPEYIPGIGRVDVNTTLGFDISRSGVISGSGNVSNKRFSGNVAFFGNVPFEPFAVPEPASLETVAIALGCFFLVFKRW